jgi:long-chain acyl-CoA synthetase
MNLKEKLEKTSLEDPQKTAIQAKKGEDWLNITYQDLRDKILSLSSWMKKEGIAKGERVAIISGNCIEWPVIFFATLYIGAVSVPISPDSKRSEIENILKDSEAKLIFAKGNAVLLRLDKKIIDIDSKEFKDILLTGKSDISEDMLPGNLACILYTSGTTDEPKGVALSHENLLSNCNSLYSLKIFTTDDSVLSILPLHHAYALTVGMLLPLLHGCKIIYPESIRADAILKAFKETNPTFFVAVPQIFYLFHKNITEAFKKIPFALRILINMLIAISYKLKHATGLNAAPIFLRGLHARFGSRLRFFISGGAKLDPEIATSLFRLGFTILEGYGLTETSPVLTMNPVRRPNIGSVGLPIPGVDLKISNRNKEGIGEVVVKGPNIMQGYYRRKEETRQAIKDGWFYTGDLGYLDKDGYLFLTGRVKEVIVLSSGLNIYPAEIEEAYIKSAPVKEMCVFEAQAKKGLEESFVLWAVVVPDLGYFREYGEVNLRSVIKERFDNVSRELPPHKRIMGFYITVDRLPRTVLGKIKRFEVKETYSSKVAEERDRVSDKKELSREDLLLMESGIANKVIDYLKKWTKTKKEIRPDDLLELDLGIDSLGRIELASAVEQEFNMEIKEEVLGNAFTVRDLIVGIEALVKNGKRNLSEDEREITFGHDYWRRLFEVLPKEENLNKIDLNPGPLAWVVNFLFNCIDCLFFRLFYRLKTEGRENIPEEGPYILYVTHTSFYDGLVFVASLGVFPRMDLFFLGFRPYFNVPIVRNLMKLGRVIPLDFSSHLLEALRGTYHVLKNGKALCLFPEGVRTLDGKIGEFKKGFGILAKESGARLIPVVLEGVYEAWPRTARFPRLYPMKVKFGKAIDPKELEEKGLKMGAKDNFEAICMAARDQLVRLKVTSCKKA